MKQELILIQPQEELTVAAHSLGIDQILLCNFEQIKERLSTGPGGVLVVPS